jgi:hypothetical protein
MIDLPDFDRAWEYENNFYLSCENSRISKLLAHYELYKRVRDTPGAIVEWGVFKGASFARFAMFRELFGNPYSKELIGFDTFGSFPETEFEPDKEYREEFIDAAGEESISVDQLRSVLANKGIEEHFELIEGDITETVPDYADENPELKISLLNIDTDIYEPATTILEHLYPRVVSGGIVIFDDYGTFPGETKAIDEYFDDGEIEIKKFPFAMTPCYAVKP